jgi:hypothetical protein
MSIDRIQSVPGRLTLSPELDASSLPGLLALGPNAGVASGAVAQAGGALYTAHTPKAGAVPAPISSGTLTHNNYGVMVVNPAAAITGVILTAGSFPGQRLVIINQAVAGNTITFAAVGTSLVANGVSCVIAGTKGMELVWNALDSKWYPLA